MASENTAGVQSMDEIATEYDTDGTDDRTGLREFGRAARRHWTLWAGGIIALAFVRVAFRMETTGPFDEVLFGVVAALLFLVAFGMTLDESEVTGS